MTALSPPLRYYLFTYGCQMNEADSAAMAGALEALGYSPTPHAEEADLVLLNTCSVREKPEQKVYSRLGELREIKAARPELIIAVAGCMAEREGAALRRRAPHVDLVIGTRQFHRLPELVAQLRAARGPVVAVGPNGEPSRPAMESACSPELPAGRPAGTNAFVPIIRGCNNRCAYCIVPSVRGPEISRPVDAVLGEVERAIAAGAVEITLLGQNVLAYGRNRDDGWPFARLLAAVHDVPGLVRLRFLTCHPRDVDDSLIRAMADLPKVCERIHLPLQAGDNQLLAAMGRGYTVERYFEVLARLREGVPGLTVTTDLMVGFPGETEEQFEASLAVYAAARFDAAFTFAYSPRPGTRAAAKEQFPRSVTQARLTRLIEQQNRITCEVHAAAVGKVVEVLVDGRSEKISGQLTARTRGHHAAVLAGGPELIGRTLSVRLTSAHPWGFHAEPTADS